MTLAPEGRTELGLSGGGCSCCAPPVHSVSAAEPVQGEAESATSSLLAHSSEFAVEGMTCGNCVRHVTEELGAVRGVDSVEVELIAGGVSTVILRGSAPVDHSAIAAAVAEAGYRVMPR